MVAPTEHILGKSVGSTFVDGSTHPTQICFQNLSKSLISVVWLDYEGNKKQYATIRPGKIASQSKATRNLLPSQGHSDSAELVQDLCSL